MRKLPLLAVTHLNHNYSAVGITRQGEHLVRHTADSRRPQLSHE